MMRVTQERYHGGLLVERVVSEYEVDPPNVDPPAADALVEESSSTPLVSMSEWLASHGRNGNTG